VQITITISIYYVIICNYCHNQKDDREHNISTFQAQQKQTQTCRWVTDSDSWNTPALH